jgi:hypothetical protein
MENSMITDVLDNIVWYVDSRASNHMTNHGEWFRNTKDLKTSGFVETNCYNPSFGAVTRARDCNGTGQEYSPRVTFHAPWNVGECEGMNPHIPK